MSDIDFAALKAPFALHNLTWMITPGTVTKNGAKISAKCLVYVTSRAVQERLDDVCGPARWRNEFVAVDEPRGWLCGISILVDGEWVTKWDAAENTDIEPLKGGVSGATKRAGSQWGVGRYLYYLPEAWAIVQSSGRYYYGGNAKLKGKQDKQYVSFNWDPPSLPEWALPSGEGAPPADHISPTGEVANSQILCPVLGCGAPCWDHREKKKGTNAISERRPDIACSSPSCDWAVWMETWANDILGEIEAAHGAELIDSEARLLSEEYVRKQDARKMAQVQARLNELAEGGT